MKRNLVQKFLQFGESTPALLEDYRVPHLFQEDLFDVLDYEQRPAFRWLIIGPERSGASWHVDPGLTSAWNTLLCGRKSLDSHVFCICVHRCYLIVHPSCGACHLVQNFEASRS